MTGRVRKPTARALDAAESRLLYSGALPSLSSRASSSSYASPSFSPSAAAPVKRNGRAVNDKGKQAIAAQAAHLVGQPALTEADDEDDLDDGENDSNGGGEQDLTLYCVCLGYDTGEQPMIQCEHCSNWFHFSCVGLNDELSAKIEAYSCDMCEQMGMGPTRLLGAAPALPLALPPSAFSNLPPPSVGFPPEQPQPDGGFDLANLPTSGEEDDDEELEEEDEDEEDEDFEEKEERAKRGKAQGKRGRAEDEDWGSESDEDDGKKERAKKPPRKRRPAPGARPASTDVKHVRTGPAPSVPNTDKVRAAVIKQLTTFFSSIFSATSTDGPSAGTDVRSAALAEEVELELFEAFAELDDKGYRAPRPKYSQKFRSLAYNLKSNAVLRSRVAENELSAKSIANLTPEDLQTPEYRAMAAKVRAASLRFSVKEEMAAPTAKRTHKGEEEIDNEASRIVAAEEAERAQAELSRKKAERERSGSASIAGSPAPGHADSPSVGSPPHSPSTRDSPSAFLPSSSTSTPRIRSALPTSSLAYSSSVDELNRLGAASPAQQGSPPPGDAGSPPVKQEPQGDMSPPPPPDKRRSSSNFDMASIWGKVKQASPPLASTDIFDSPMPALEDGDANNDVAEDEPYEPADPFNLGGEGGPDDFDEDDLFRDPNASPKKKAPPRPPTPTIDELPSVWSGDVLVPEEGGFPSLAVQVGGRPLGFEPSTWQQLLPRTLSTAGRISTAQAVKYLVDCSFSPKRELVIVALLPDLSGPSPSAPHKPAPNRCKTKHRHIFDVYVKRDRIGVVPPPKELQRLVRDIYIVPLKKDDDLPEYGELADEHCIPETGKRKEDLLLGVLVVTKGALPTVKPAPPPSPTEPTPPPPPPSAPTVPTGPKALSTIPTGPRAMQGFSPPPASAAPAGFSPPPPPQPAATPSFDPSAVQNLLSGFDPSALSSLLNNPALMGALNGTPPPPPAGPAAGGYGQPFQRSPPPPQQPQQQQQQHGYVHPSRAAMMPGGGAAGGFDHQ
ncbi:hypothetical protein JCM8547_001873 [Rhodosporidiobolus lusitaniae]